MLFAIRFCYACTFNTFGDKHRSAGPNGWANKRSNDIGKYGRLATGPRELLLLLLLQKPGRNTCSMGNGGGCHNWLVVRLPASCIQSRRFSSTCGATLAPGHNIMHTKTCHYTHDLPCSSNVCVQRTTTKYLLIENVDWTQVRCLSLSFGLAPLTCSPVVLQRDTRLL